MNRTSPFAWFTKLDWTPPPPLEAHLPLPPIHLPKPSLIFGLPRIICFLPTHCSKFLSPILKYHLFPNVKLFPFDLIVSSASSPPQGTIPGPIFSSAPCLPQITILEPIFILKPHFLPKDTSSPQPIFSQTPQYPRPLSIPEGTYSSRPYHFLEEHLLLGPISSLSPPSP